MEKNFSLVTAMDNVDFIIPYMSDSSVRYHNKQYVCDYLLGMEAYPNVVEQWNGIQEMPEESNRINFITKELHFLKCRLINFASRQLDNPIICVYDCDVIIPKSQLLYAIELILNNLYDMVYPYDGTFENIIGIDYTKNFESQKNEVEYQNLHENSVGGCFMISRKKFREIGGMNENMKSWGFEDNELYVRAKKLGLRIDRTSGVCYHLDHPRGLTSSDKNPFYQANEKEYIKIQNMSEKKLRKYIDTWKWAK